MGVLRRTVRIAAMAGLATAISACQTTGLDSRPPVTLPAAFSATGTATLPDKWWRAFDDPVLDDLIEDALADNLSIHSAWDRLVQAEATARKAGASLLPSLNAEVGLSGTRQKGQSTNSNSSRRVISSTSDLSLGLSSSYEVDLWGGIASTRDAAGLDANASEEDLKTAAITLASDVTKTWYQLIEAYGQIDLLRRQLATDEQVLEIVTLKFRRGQVTASDVLQQRQQVESKRGDLAITESQSRVLEHKMAILLGKAPTSLEIPQINALVTLPDLPGTGLPVNLVQRRPDLRRAYFAVLAADRRTAAAIADRFPSLTLTARVETSGEYVRDLFTNWLGSLAAGLVAPLFDADLRAAEVERTRAVTSEALNDYGTAVLDALGEVEDALVQEANQRRYLTSLESQIELADQAFQRIRDTYIGGAADYIEVLNALLTSQALERTYLQAQRQLIEYRVDLYRALGGGWEMSRPEGTGVAAGTGGAADLQPVARQGRKG